MVNVGPGGKADNVDDLKHTIEMLARMAGRAETFGVTLCVKAHVGAAIWNTPTTLEAMAQIDSPAFGIDMDPSHIHRGGEIPKDALKQVISRVRHVHIRDCAGPGPSPGPPEMQACGRGDIDLAGYCQVLVEAGYDGPVNLEVIGAAEYREPLRHHRRRIVRIPERVFESVRRALEGKPPCPSDSPTS